MKPDLREALKTKVLVGDGAMGTFFYTGWDFRSEFRMRK